jgi:hypothetical protein
MYKLKVGEVATVLTHVMAASKEAAAYDRAHPGEEAPKEAIGHIQDAVEKLQSFQQNLQLDEALCTQLFVLQSSLKTGRADLRANALQVQLEAIVFGLLSNLRSRLFLFVPSDRAAFYWNFSLFGQAPYIFDEAVFDMLDAGNSYVANLPNACIFHSMRVSEHGLRAIARKVKVTLRKHKNKCPIEYADWEQVITAIENKIIAIRRKPIGPKKNSELIFYSEAANQCRHIRDIWRNEISHTRKRYTLPEAYAAMSRVAEFMKLLTNGLYSEKDFKHKVLNFAARALGQPALTRTTSGANESTIAP